MKAFYIREQQHICGKNETEANYKEVDFFLVNRKQHRANLRAKKKLASSQVQKNLNDKKSKRWFAQLAHTNFTEDDLVLHPTFSDKYHPTSEAEAYKMLGNYIDRINYHRNKQGLPPAKYLAVMELQGKKKPRYHFHILIDGLLPGKTLRELWSTGRGKNKERLGTCRIDNLDFEGYGGTILDLCSYMLKGPEGKRRWRSSLYLEKPKLPRPNDTKYSRAKLAEICKYRLDDFDWWRQQYPGWELVEPAQANYNDFTGWSLYAKFKRCKNSRAKPPNSI